MRAATMTTRSSVATAMRPKLADVTNLPAPRNENLPETSMGDKDRVEQLTKERMALIKLVTERNKIIELSGAELQKLRVSVQKLQLQNWNLARSNSQMLAELNSRRDTVKALRHELLCKEALLKAKNSELQLNEAAEVTLPEVEKDDKPCIGNKKRATRSQSLGASAKFQKVEHTLPGKEEINCLTTGHQVTDGGKSALLEAAKDVKLCVGNKRRSTRSQSMGASTTCQNIDQKDNIENKRRSLRRQSSRFKCDEQEQTANLFEIKEAKFPEDPMLEDDTVPSVSSNKQEENKDSLAAKSEGVSERSSIERPLRKTIKKDTRFPENLIPEGDMTFSVLSTKKEKEETSAPKSEGASHRCSLGRPTRKAVEKIQSYKEPPLHLKMRRAE